MIETSEKHKEVRAAVVVSNAISWLLEERVITWQSNATADRGCVQLDTDRGKRRGIFVLTSVRHFVCLMYPVAGLEGDGHNSPPP